MTRLLQNRSFQLKEEVTVDGDEFNYLIRVRRHRCSDIVEIQGLKGQRVQCRIADVSRDRATLIVEQALPKAVLCWPVSLFVAVPKRNLMDDIVRKTSEIGIERLFPVHTERSVARPSPAKVARWQRIASESVRQCGRETMLVVDKIRPLEEALLLADPHGSKFVLHPYQSGETEVQSLFSNHAPPAPIAIAVGPEGGFTDNEIALASKLGFTQARLGASIMRVETAAIAAAVLSVALLGGY